MLDTEGSNLAILFEQPEPVAAARTVQAALLEGERAHKTARYSTDPRIKATSMIGTTIGGTNHESICAPCNEGRNAALRPDVEP
jgi:hypothetical protein